MERRGIHDSVNQLEEAEGKQAECGAWRQVEKIVLLGIEAAQGDERGKQKDARAGERKQMAGGQGCDRGVHAGKAVGAGVQALNEGQETLGPPTAQVAGAPFDWRSHGNESE